MRRRSVLIFVVCAIAWVQAPAPVRSSDRFDSRALVADLRALSADDMEGRLVGSPGGAKARRYIIERFRAAGLKPFGASYEQPFTFAARGRGGAAATERSGVNVVGYVEGRRSSGRYLVLSAHYDHIGVRDGLVFNGADDNASGTAALLTLASYFASHQPANPVIFAAFDGEESGLRGASAFVANPPVDASAIVLDLNMDMIGRDPDDKLFVVGTFLQPFLKPYIEKAAASAPVKLLIGHDDPGQRGVEDWTRDSDHWAFIQARIPALYFGVEDFDQHHKATDDFETMTLDFYVRAVETMVAVTEIFDQNLEDISRARK